MKPSAYVFMLFGLLATAIARAPLALAASDSAMNAPSLPPAGSTSQSTPSQSGGSNANQNGIGATGSTPVGTLNGASPSGTALPSEVNGQSAQAGLHSVADAKGTVGLAANEQIRDAWAKTQDVCTKAVRFYVGQVKKDYAKSMENSAEIEQYMGTCGVSSSEAKPGSVPLPFAAGGKTTSDGDGPDEAELFRIKKLVGKSESADLSDKDHYCATLAESDCVRHGHKAAANLENSLNQMRLKGLDCLHELGVVAALTLAGKANTTLAEGQDVRSLTPEDREKILKGEFNIDRDTLVFFANRVVPMVVPVIDMLAEQGSTQVTAKHVNLGAEVITAAAAQMFAVLDKSVKDMKPMIATNLEETQSLKSATAAGQITGRDLGAGAAGSASSLTQGLDVGTLAGAAAAWKAGATPSTVMSMSGVQANAVSRSAIDGSSSRGLNASAADVAKLSSSTMPTQLSTARSPASAPQNLNAKDEEVFAQAFAAAEQKWRARGMEPDLTSVMSMASEALARFRASGGN